MTKKPGPSPPGAHVLLVEDDEQVAHVLRESLSRQGYEVHVARNVRQALHVFDEASIEVVVTDLVMPGGSGLDLLRDIEERDPMAPVIIITANESLEAAAQAVREHAFDYLTKPVSRGQLQDAVERALASRRRDKVQRDEQDRLRIEHRALALRHQRTATLLSVLFNQAQEGILVFDDRGRLMDASDSFVTLVGDPLFELLDRDTRAMFDPHPTSGELHERVMALIDSEASQGHWRGAVTVRTVRGRHLPARMSLSLCEIAGDGEHTRYVVGLLYFDQSHEEVSHHLQQADRLATMGLLAGSAAHEIKNDLGPLLGYLSMIERGDQDPVESGMVGLMRDSVRRVHEQVEQILEPLRPRVRAPGAVVLRDSVDAIIELLRRAGRARRVDLQIDGDEEVIVHADKTEVHQIATNLITNALDALGDGGGKHRGEIRIELRTEGDLGCLSVRDSGCGIPPEVKARVLEPFFTTKGDGGTGLGLPVVHDIVRSLGGRLEMTSEVGQGTAVKAFLPLYRAESPGD